MEEELIPLGTWPCYACVFVPKSLMRSMQELGFLDAFVRRFFGSALTSCCEKKRAFALSMLRTPVCTLQQVELKSIELTDVENLCVSLIYASASNSFSTYDNFWKYLPALPEYTSTTGPLMRTLALVLYRLNVIFSMRRHEGWPAFWSDALLYLRTDDRLCDARVIIYEVQRTPAMDATLADLLDYERLSRILESAQQCNCVEKLCAVAPLVWRALFSFTRYVPTRSEVEVDSRLQMEADEALFSLFNE